MVAELAHGQEQLAISTSELHQPGPAYIVKLGFLKVWYDNERSDPNAIDTGHRSHGATYW
jgi:hypothetical protein